MGPGDLQQLLRGLALPRNENLIVGIDGSDDAGVYRLDDSTALILTVDFFTPIVDDPYAFGAIAAANALSDIYAMGAKPLVALNLAAFPEKEDKELLRAVLRGGADKIAEAGAVIAGGHSIKDPELKYGLAVVGLAAPNRIITNANAQPGDALVLTKPLGTGLLATARRRDAITEEEFQPAVETMLALNRLASEAMLDLGAHACTDITGFGLLGHAQEMACASIVGIQIHLSQLPLLPRAQECAEKGFAPGGTKKNQEHFRDRVHGDPPSPAWWDMLFDPQTSGGLLISLEPKNADLLVRRLEEKGILARVIGEVLPEPGGRIIVSP